MSFIERIPRKLPTIQSVRNNVQAEAPLLVFYTVVLLVLAFLYINSFSLRVESARIPRMVIVATIAIIVLHIVTIFLNFNPSGMTGPNTEEFLEEDIEISNVDLVSLIREMIWIVGYVLGFFYIGFFTTTAAFVYSYIFVKDKDTSGLRRFIVPGYWSIGVTVFLYFILITVLEVYKILRIGILP